MTLADLITRYRFLANDKVEPYFVSDSELTGLFNDAQREACIRGRLIHEATDPAMCQIAVVAGQDTYPLHPLVYELTYCGYLVPGDDERTRLDLVSTEWLDSHTFYWREKQGRPEFAVQRDKTIRLVRPPDLDATLYLEAYRLPLADLVAPTDVPEINGAHHVHLVQWALHKAFSIPDAEFFDQGRADKALAEFEAYFGLRPDADLRRITREDVPHHVEAWWV